jgi:hypothetical protein
METFVIKAANYYLIVSVAAEDGRGNDSTDEA